MNDQSKSTSAPSRRCVLFVDDDNAFLETIQGLMETLSRGQWHVLTADSAAKTLDALKAQAVDLVVIDAQMPVMDGMQTLALLNRSHPSLQKVILTGFADEQYRAASLRAGAELVLVKPTARDGWETIFTVLNELVRHHPEDGFRGVLRRVGLHDVIQMECLSRKSSVLEISNAQSHGQIFFADGSIIHAQIGERSGEEAFNQILAMTGGQFNLKPFVEPPARTISGQWEFLLMEAAQKVDEAAQSEASPAAVPSTDAPPPIPTAKPSEIGKTDIFRSSKPLATPVELQRPTVEAVLICSERGEVLQEWRCSDTALWLNFFEVLSRKTQGIAEVVKLGEFDRLEIMSGDTRAVVILGHDRRVMIKTRQEGRQTGAVTAGKSAAPMSKERKQEIKDWLRRSPALPGTLARGIRFADQTFDCDSNARDFPLKAMEQTWNAIADIFQALNTHLLSPTRLTFTYEQAMLHYARREDGALLGVFIASQKANDDSAGWARFFSEFRAVRG